MTLARRVAISKEIGFLVANLPEGYLGIKIVKGRVNKEAVSNVIDSLSRKLSKIQGNDVIYSKGGINQVSVRRISDLLNGCL